MIVQTRRLIFAEMANDSFSFRQFTVRQRPGVFRVGTDGVLLGAAADVSGAERILDIGSGTGLIAMMLAQRSAAEIHAIEPDMASFEQLKENIAGCRWSGRVNLHNKKLQDFYPGITFDLVVSNPPFFTDSLKNPDQQKASFRHDVTLTHNDLLEGAARLTGFDGRFVVIMPWAEGNLLIAEAAGFGLYSNHILKIRPLPTSPFRRMIITFSRLKTKPSENILTIEHGRRHDFTEEYRKLTGDFYLKL